MTASPLLVFTDAAMALHDPGPGFPERAARLVAAQRAIAGRPDVEIHRPAPIDREQLVAVHDPAYVDALLGAAGQAFAIDVETRGGPDSVEAIRLAAGAAREAALAAVDGSPAFALVRPPGHHATRGNGMGFCFVNNVVIGAHAARRERGIRRILVVDWDVHHGNGTEDLVRGDDDILFFSCHQGGGGFYPGTGLRSQGNALNVPLDPGAGDAEMLQAFQSVLRPAVDAFEPELVLVSAGFDAHADDALAGMQMTVEGFATLCQEVRDIADTYAEGRIALTLEGGYDLDALTACVGACVDVLTA